MSVSVTRQDTYECGLDECENTRTKTSSVKGSFCSHECAARHEGRKLLRNIRDDHRFCWSCWRARKTIERPTAEARRGLGPITDDALVGFEYQTEHVEMGPHGLECECGACEHRITDYLQREAGPYHWYLKLIVEQLNDEGQDDRTLDFERFADLYWETEDLELAVGGALSD